MFRAFESSDYLPQPLLIEDDKSKSIIRNLSNPHDDLIMAIKENRTNLSTLVKEEKELNVKNAAIMRFLADSDDDSTVLPAGLNKDNMVKMKRTMQMHTNIMRYNDLLTADIDMIYDDLKSMAANIKSVLAILKRLTGDDILVFIEQNVDEAALNRLKENVRRKLSNEITDYDRQNNEKLKKQLDDYEEILNSAKSVTDLAQRIIDDNKKGGFFSYKKKGGNQEIQELTVSFKDHLAKISDEIYKLDSDIKETKDLIGRYNENKGKLANNSELDDSDEQILKFNKNIEDATENKKKVIEQLESEQDSIIKGLEQNLVSYKENKSAEIKNLNSKRGQLILDIKRKVAAIKNLKTTTKKTIEDANRILTRKSDIINRLLEEKRRELDEINAIIETTGLDLINRRQQKETEEKQINIALEQKNEEIAQIASELTSLERQKKELIDNITIAETTNSQTKAEIQELQNTIRDFEEKLDKVDSRDILKEYISGEDEIKEILGEDKTSVSQEPEGTSVVSARQQQYNKKLLDIFYRVKRFIERNTDDDFQKEVEFLKRFNDTAADVNALVQEFKVNAGVDKDFYPHNENQKLIDSLAVS